MLPRARFRRAPPPARLVLRRASGTPGWMALLLRILLVFGLIGIALTAHWLDRGGLRDNVDGEISFTDVLYFTMITVTTVGYGDIVPVTDRARMFDTFLVTPIRVFVWLIFLGTAYQFLLRNVWEAWVMNRIQQHLHDHVIVAGFGTSGEETVRELIRRGLPPKQIVVVDVRPTALAEAEGLGVAVLEGDATRNATLEAVKIGRARCMAVSAGRDDTSILIVLTARGMAPEVAISVVVKADDNEELARQAGATTVINPASFAGLLLAGSAHGPHIAEYMADLAATDGKVALTERKVTVAETGRPLSSIGTGLGVRIYRGDKSFGFWEPESAALQPGDSILEIVPRSRGAA
jgi:voltage-gated potassium channel